MEKWTAQQARDVARIELERVTEKYNAQKSSNNKKDVATWEAVQDLLDCLPDGFTFESEAYATERIVPVFNIGTFAEQLLQYAYMHRKTKKATTADFDHRIKGRKVEYKASISANRLNTPYNGKNDVLLLVGRQVVYMDAATAMEAVNERGRFKFGDYTDYMTEDEERAEIARSIQEFIFGE